MESAQQQKPQQTNRMAGEDHEDHASPFMNDVSGIKQSVAQLRTDVTNLMQKAVSAGHSGAAAVQSQAGQTFQDLAKSVGDSLGGLKETSANSVKAVGRHIQEHPVRSAMIGIGIGYFLARMLSRR